MCVCVPVLCYLYVVCVMKLAACTGNAAQSLLSSHGLTECLRREQPEAGVGKVPTNPATGKKVCRQTWET